MFVSILNFSFVELITGALLGFTLAILYDQYKICRLNRKAKKSYAPLEGFYVSYDSGKVVKAKAHIVHISGNILKISVFHSVNSRKWEGTVKMSSETFGTASYAYDDDPSEVGLKTIVPFLNKRGFILIPEDYYMNSGNREYDKEEFTRSNI